jgi:rhamnulose-1-phosphate aldolase
MQELTKNKSFLSLLSEIKQISGLLWIKGWAEANAGNFSVNITELFKTTSFKLDKSKGIRTNKIYKHLNNHIILFSCSGSKMRDIAENPLPELCLLYINRVGNIYYNIPLDNNINKKPTSELLTHLEIQNLLSEKKSDNKVVIHTHPAEVIALTHIKKFCNEKNLNKLLFSVQPEVSFIFPEGIGFVPYYTTGSEKLAIETKKKFIKHNMVLWEKHGCVSAGKNFNDTFDKIDVLVKSIKIFFMSLSSGNNPEGLSVYKIKELKKLNSIQ